MAIDVIAYNALARSIDVKKDLIAQERCLRDSSDSYAANTTALLTSYQALIDSADSFISCYTPQVSGDYDITCFHTKFQSCMTPPSNCGFSGIRLLNEDNGGQTTTNICIYDCGQYGSYAQCGRNCSWTVPAATDRVGIFVQAPGGPSYTANCCGGTAWGPTGGFIQVVYCVNPGDSFIFCSGCSCCCAPYCCGYTHYRSCNSYVCTCIGGVAGCIIACSPSPNMCCETQARNNYSGGNATYNNNWCIWHGSQISCGGYSACHAGEQGNCWFDCHGPWNCHLNPRDACGHQYDYFSPIITSGSAGNIDNVVAGSCFSAPGWWHWSTRSENCHWGCTPGTAFALKVYGCDGACCWCSSNTHCCGFQWSHNNGYFRTQGHGGSPGMMCGGYNNYYADMGRSGGVYVQYC